MKFRFDTATKIVPLVLVVIGILLALLLPWQCAKSQTYNVGNTGGQMGLEFFNINGTSHLVNTDVEITVHYQMSNTTASTQPIFLVL